VDKTDPVRELSTAELLYEKLIEFEPKLDRLMAILRAVEGSEQEDQLGEQWEQGRVRSSSGSEKEVAQ
jgi:hypothetical protein